MVSDIMLIIVSFILFPAVVVWHMHSRRRVARAIGAIQDEKQKLLDRVRDVEGSLTRHAETEAWLNRVLQEAPHIALVYGVDSNGLPSTFTLVNDLACRTLEYQRERLLGLSVFDIETIASPAMPTAQVGVDLMSLDNKDQLARGSSFATRNLQNFVRRVMQGERVTYESSFVSRTGKRIPVEITAVRIDLQGQPRIVSSVENITERKRNDRALRESEQRLKDFFTTAPIGVATYSAQQLLLDVNMSCLRIFGAPDSKEFARFSLLDNACLPETARAGIRRGETVRCEMVVDFGAVVQAGTLVSSRKGIGYFDVLANNLGYDHDFNPRGYLVQIQDITDKRETEDLLDQYDKKLRQAQKMEAIGTMAGGIAHDFNNILSPILGYAEIGMDMCPKGEKLHDFMREIRHSTLRAKDLVHQILTFSRQTEAASSSIHLIPIVKEVSKQQRAVLPEGIEVTYTVRTDEDLVIANPTQIHQILTNLCTNAAYAMKETGGTLDIRLSNFALAWRHRHEFPQLKKGRYIRLSVRDTGTGIDATTLEHIFDPFFSTKPTGEGTGMGLSVVRGIVTSMGGAITVDTKCDEGTTFHVALPLIEKQQEAADVETDAPPAGTERILFVDDEKGITRMADHMLASLGYNATVLTDSLQALEVFSRSPEQFDLVISDQVMPDLTGSDMIARMRAIRPDLPAIICSGFSESLSADDAKAMGIGQFLMKPISRRDLARAIRRSMGEAIPDDSPPEPAQPEVAPDNPDATA
jgi:signal transduction histidine kinase/ActR/RegA family two-component response regulator